MKPVIHDAEYRVIDVVSLPDEIQAELCEECPGNNSGRIINPEYHPKLLAWLKQQPEYRDTRPDIHKKDTECFIGWWSW